MLTTHDPGIREMAMVSGQLSYLLLCLSLCWGIFTATGWVHRLAGKQAARTSHLVLASLAMAFGALHGAAFLLLSTHPLTVPRILVPFLPGDAVRWSLGIAGLELLVTVALVAGLARRLGHPRWVRLHRLAYPATGLCLGHALWGALANGTLDVVWLGGLAVLVPTLLTVTLRLVPPAELVRAGLLEGPK